MIPSTKELFRIFSRVNRDCAKSGESVVSFDDTEYYWEQIDAIWDGNSLAAVSDAAEELKAYATAQGYVLPKRRRTISLKDLGKEYDFVIVTVPGQGERECRPSEVKIGELVELPLRDGDIPETDEEIVSDMAFYEVVESAPIDVVNKLLEDNADTTRHRVENHYECCCGTTWIDTWDCACNDKCPKCNREVEPVKSNDLLLDL